MDDRYEEITDAFTGEVVRVEKAARHYETPDPTPKEPPVGYKKQPSIFDLMREQIRKSREEADQDARDRAEETFEESEDFDIPDDPIAASPWEEAFDPIHGGTYEPGYVDKVKAKIIADYEATKAAEAASDRGEGGAAPPTAKPSGPPEAAPTKAS